MLMNILTFTCRCHLSGRALMEVLAKLSGLRSDVVGIDPTVWVAVVGGKPDVSDAQLENISTGVTTERILLPISCNGSHWRVIMVKLQTGEIRHYDAMTSSCALSVRAVAQRIVQYIPHTMALTLRILTSPIWGYK